MSSLSSSSKRERRLCAWTLVVLVGIYSTLGLTPALAESLESRGLIVAAFLVSMMLVGAAILTQGLKIRPAGLEIGVALGVTAVYLLVFVRMANPERSHLIEYGVVAVIIFEALQERSRRRPGACSPWLSAVAAGSAAGVVDECIQAVLPNRVFETTDILFNVLAVVMAVATMAALHWARRRTARNDSGKRDQS